MLFSLALFVDSAFNMSSSSDRQSYNVDEYSFDFYFQAIVAGNYMIQDVLSREVLEIDYLDQSHYNAKVSGAVYDALILSVSFTQRI